MNSSDGGATFNRPPNARTIETQEIGVTVTTDDYEIDGFMHIKPGGYQSRISDLLNIKELQFIPLTRVTYRSLRRPDEPPHTCDTLILKLNTIKMVVPHDNYDLTAENPGEQKLPEAIKNTDNWQS